MPESGKTKEQLLAELEEARAMLARFEDGSRQLRYLASIVESSDDAIIGKALDGAIISWNSGAERLYGFTRREVLGRHVSMLIPGERAGDLAFILDRIRSGERLSNFETVRRAKDGRLVDVSLTVSPVYGQDGELIGSSTAARDITERKKAESALKEAEKTNRELVEHAPIGIFRSSPGGRYLMANTQLAKIYGYASVRDLMESVVDIGRQSYVDAADRAEALRLLHEGGVSRRTSRRFRKDGSVIWVATSTRAVRGESGGLLYYEGFASDVTDRVRMEEAMVQAEKMATVGGLAAGMAHEINNPLSGILQGAQVAIARLLPEAPANLKAAERAGCPMESLQAYLHDRHVPEFLEAVRDSAKRAAGIVSNMLAFSKRSTSDWCEYDLNGIVEMAVDLCMQDYNLADRYDFKRIALTREYSAPALPAVCSGPQIQQVLFNLLRNAAQAMALAETPAPAIAVRTHSDGSHAVIEVRDNGPGMDEATRKSIFEPFFTTKAPGKGTGLGLFVSYFIVVSHHHGAIEVDSEPGKGATFTVRIPLRRQWQPAAAVSPRC